MKVDRSVPLEELLVRERADLEPADTLSADRIYERRWALTLLEQVLARLGEEYQVAGNSALFEQLKQMLSDEPGRPSQAKIAQELGMTENASKAGIPSSASAISVVVTRGDCANGGGAGRRRRGVAAFHCRIANVTSNKIWHSTMEVSNCPKTTATNAIRVCGKCGSKIFADAPQGFCSLCLFKTGLGPLSRMKMTMLSNRVPAPMRVGLRRLRVVEGNRPGRSGGSLSRPAKKSQPNGCIKSHWRRSMGDRSTSETLSSRS